MAPPAHRLPPQLQAEPELSCCIPHPASLLCQGTMEHYPHRVPTVGASSSQDAEMPMPPGWGGGRGQVPEAKHPRERGKKLPPPPASSSESRRDQPPPGCFLNSAHFPACQAPCPSGGGGCQQGKPVALGVGLLFSIRTWDARGSERTARVPKAPPPPPCPTLGDVTHPCTGNVQLPAQPSLPGLGARKEQSHPAAEKGKLKGEADRDGACSLSPLRTGSAIEMDERPACLTPEPRAG